MDRAVIEEKLESQRRCLLRIQAKCPSNVELLEKDADLQDIITLNLTRAVQLSVDMAAHWLAELDDAVIPGTMGGLFDSLEKNDRIGGELAARMKAAVGFRNIAIHNYETIDWQIVHAICHNQLNDFSDFSKAVYLALVAQES